MLREIRIFYEIFNKALIEVFFSHVKHLCFRIPASIPMSRTSSWPIWFTNKRFGNVNIWKMFYHSCC